MVTNDSEGAANTLGKQTGLRGEVITLYDLDLPGLWRIRGCLWAVINTGAAGSLTYFWLVPRALRHRRRPVDGGLGQLCPRLVTDRARLEALAQEGVRHQRPGQSLFTTKPGNGGARAPCRRSCWATRRARERELWQCEARDCAANPGLGRAIARARRGAGADCSVFLLLEHGSS